MNLAWSVPLPPPAKLVLVALADRADDTGRAWPFATELVERTGLSSATLTRHLGALVAAGLVTQQRRRRTSALYMVQEEALRVAAAATPSTSTQQGGSGGRKHGLVSNPPVVGRSNRPVGTVPKASKKPQTDGNRSDGSRNTNNHSGHQEPSERWIPKATHQEQPILFVEPTDERTPSTDRFPEFWAVYPKRGSHSMSKDDARKAWATILKTIHKPDADGVTWTVDQIIAGARRYARECENITDRVYVKTPGPWLRKGMWKYEDDAPTAVGVEDWLRAQWTAGKVIEIHQEYRTGYTEPATGQNALLHNRAWIEAHRDAIIAQITNEAL